MSRMLDSSENPVEDVLVSIFRTTDGGKSLTCKSYNQCPNTVIDNIRRVQRRRLPQRERDIVWYSTNGLCYLCKKILPRYSPWHVEHVIAFSENPVQNDTLGNMLPACQSCNLRKSNNALLDCIRLDDTFDLATAAKHAPHLNTAARNAVLVALRAKHDREVIRDIGISSNISSVQDLEGLLEEIESRLQRDGEDEDSAVTSGSASGIARGYLLDRENVSWKMSDGASVRLGSFGEVCQGSLRLRGGGGPEPEETTVTVAVKFPKVHIRAVKDALLHEIGVLARFQHEHIVRFHGWFIRSSDDDDDEDDEIDRQATGTAAVTAPSMRGVGIVLEWCSHSLNMSTAIQNIDPFAIFYGISSALAYMHSYNCVHRDVKPANILIHRAPGSPWSACVGKLCDFGSAKVLTHEDPRLNQHTANAGTASFRPPEVRNGKCVPAGDVYSLGQTMSVVLKENNKSLARDGRLAQLWSDLVTAMCKEYSARPSAAAVSEALRDKRALVPQPRLGPSNEPLGTNLSRVKAQSARSPPRQTQRSRSPPNQTQSTTRSPPRQTQRSRSPPNQTQSTTRSPPRQTQRSRSPPNQTQSTTRSPPRQTPTQTLPVRSEQLQHESDVGLDLDRCLGFVTPRSTARHKAASAKRTEQRSTSSTPPSRQLYSPSPGYSPVATPPPHMWPHALIALSTHAPHGLPTLVVMTTRARRAELPTGDKQVRYHSSRSCGVLLNKSLCEVSEEEALFYRHTRCRNCHWPWLTPAPAPAPTPIATAAGPASELVAQTHKPEEYQVRAVLFRSLQKTSVSDDDCTGLTSAASELDDIPVQPAVTITQATPAPALSSVATPAHEVEVSECVGVGVGGLADTVGGTAHHPLACELGGVAAVAQGRAIVSTVSSLGSQAAADEASGAIEGESESEDRHHPQHAHSPLNNPLHSPCSSCLEEDHCPAVSELLSAMAALSLYEG